MHAAENALLAKTRAMYARRLTPEQYGELLNCRTSGEVAAYLKDKTPYGRHMDTTDPNTIHRGRLENRLLPPDAPYAAIHGLRKEAQEKLARVRPRSIGQASRISGVSPADVSVLIVWSAAQTRGGSGECE